MGLVRRDRVLAHRGRPFRRLSKNWSVAVENKSHSYAPGPIKTSVGFAKMHFDSDLLLRLSDNELNAISVIADRI